MTETWVGYLPRLRELGAAELLTRLGPMTCPGCGKTPTPRRSSFVLCGCGVSEATHWLFAAYGSDAIDDLTALAAKVLREGRPTLKRIA